MKEELQQVGSAGSPHNCMHYVYFHCLPDGTPFYVGKGVGKRSELMKRNYLHAAIVRKHGKENVQVDVIPCLDEDEARV